VFDTTPVDRRSFLLTAGALVVAGCSGQAVAERRNVDGTTRIGIATFTGMEELDFAGPYEVLTSWAFAAGSGVEVVTVAEKVETLRCAHGLKLVPDIAYADVGVLDVFVLPGGDSSRQLDDERFLERMRTYSKGGTLMASVCTGAFVYAKAGLLDGKTATTHWSSVDSLASYGRNIRVDHDARYVDGGNVVTAAGVSAGIDMALHLVARLDSVDRAREVRRYMQYDPQPPV
jgi:transcriptional regulator GlxA family with amidase domain